MTQGHQAVDHAVLVKALPRLTVKDFQSANDALHQALDGLEDLRWGLWWLRCIEFHFGKGLYQAGDHFGWHMHKELQIEIPLRGKFGFWFRKGTRVMLDLGDALVIPPGFDHRWKSDGPGIMIGISLAVIPRASSLGNPIVNTLKPATLSPKGIGLILDGFLSELPVSTTDDEFAVKRRRSWMYLIITRILGDLPAPVPGGPAGESTAEPSLRRERVVSKIIRYIDANIEGDLAMEQIQTVAALSARQIHRLFKEVTGESCSDYIMDRRLEIARSKLQTDPTLSIKEVAYASGFASPAHFSAKFKTHFGVTPTEYR